ncbi:PREDICTED: sphingomyelin phosphodiesterase 2 [Chrysochloris asiatica]|uniref:Sphingomyelin phosphodiesterase 2 n=1 Tax=Chrysochloris asiatica TaxID=185453 RepID=A0A9B0TEI5_CHRAS|nr:PREDICTED: sphingomyelin phosphodiesterase 2 [Chrysochloris asiatica]
MKPNFSLRLRVFNFNCWSIPYRSKHQVDRLQRLGDFLNVESFDLALLEEVWSEEDFESLRQKLLPTYPAAHYFRSGIIGSGLCIFSKHPIQELTQHVYTLNGYPYMIHHGDWFCGKAVGLLVFHVSGLVFNAYVTHLHAEYNRQRDIYLAHRVAQAWELAQFIHHTSKRADVVLLCGDLNMHPKDLGCRLLKELTGLQDAYLETQDFKGCEDGYTMVPQNCYVSQQELEPFPLGVRIDYVLYKAVSGIYISCKTLKTTTGHDPYGGTPLSDHEALMATLCVRHSPPQHSPSPTCEPAETSPLVTVLKEAWTELGLGLAQARWWMAFASGGIGLGLLLLVVLCVLVAGGKTGDVTLLLLSISVGLVLGAGAVYFFHRQEVKGLCRARAELQHMLERASKAQDQGLMPWPAQLLRQQDDRAEEQ